jgi:hypothetical protein
MAATPKWTVYFMVTSVLSFVAALYAGYVAITAEWMHIDGVEFWPLFIVFALLYVPASAKRMAEALSVGQEGRSRLMTVRARNNESVSTHQELRAWPERTVACLMAASAILVRAAVRAWTAMIIVIVLFRAVGMGVESDLWPVWTLLTVWQAFVIGGRAYRRGTLPLAGMNSREMELYCENRLSLLRDQVF